MAQAQEVALSLTDLTKCFDHIALDILFEKAVEQLYPLRVLVLALEAYMAMRYLTFQGWASGPVAGSKGDLRAPQGGSRTAGTRPR